MIRVLISRAKSLAVGFLAAVFILPTALLSSADENEADVEEVVVTATRREQSVMDVPLSIQAITSEKLELPSYRNVRDVYALVPGASVASTGEKPPEREGLQMRGSGVVMSEAGTAFHLIGYYMDDVPFINLAAFTPPPVGTFDLDRIEVLRGFQGTSYGTQSPAGAVIMRTNPVNLSEFGYKVSAGTMTYAGESRGFGNTYSGVVNIPLIEDKLAIRLGFKSENDPGFASMTSDSTLVMENPYEEDRETFRAKVLYQPNDSTSFEIIHTNWEIQTGFAIGGNLESSDGGEMLIRPFYSDTAIPFYYDPLLAEAFPTGIPVNKYEVESTSFKAKFDLNFGDLSYTLGEVDTPFMEYNTENPVVNAYGDFGWASNLTNTPAESTSHELRLVSNPIDLGGLELSYVLGYLSFDAESSANLIANVPGYGTPTYHETQLTEQDASALYGEFDFQVSDTLTIFAGLRLDDEERDFSSTNVLRADGDAPLGPYTGTLTTNDYANEFDSKSYRIGAKWNFSDTGMAYISRSQTGRAPNVFDPVAEAALELHNLTDVLIAGSDDSILDQTEIGVKVSLMESALLVEAAYSLGAWQEIPLGIYLGAPSYEYVTIGGTDADVSSYEISLSYRLSENVLMTYSSGYTGTKVTKTSDMQGYPPAIQEGGSLFNYAPNTHSLGWSYSGSMENGWSTSASFDFTYRSRPDGFAGWNDRAAEVFPSAKEAYKYGNLSFGMSKNELDVSLTITNVGDFTGAYLPLSSRRQDNIIPFPRAIHLQISYSTF